MVGVPNPWNGTQRAAEDEDVSDDSDRGDSDIEVSLRGVERERSEISDDVGCQP